MKTFKEFACLGLWLLLFFAALIGSKTYVLTPLSMLMLLALGFVCTVLAFAVEKTRWHVFILALGLGAMIGSLWPALASLVSGVFQPHGVVGLLRDAVGLFLLGLALLALFGWSIGLGKKISGQDEPVEETPELKTPNTEPAMTHAERKALRKRLAEAERRRRLSDEERISEDIAVEEQAILAAAEQIQRQTPEERAQKIRDALAREEARNAADKWMRE